jgi:O-antigen/teichoic acid export membrane protein
MEHAGMSDRQVANTPVAPPSSSAELPLEGVDLLTRVRGFLRGLDRTLVRGSVAALALNVAAMGLGFVVQVVLARALGTKEYGLYLYVIGWANVAGLLCAMEFAVAGTRFLSAYSASGQWSLLKGFLRRSHQIVGSVSLAVAAIGIVAGIAFSSRSPVSSACIIAASILFPLTGLAQLHVGLLQGLKRIVHAQAPFQVLRPILFGAGVFLLAHGLGRRDAPTAIGVQILATGAALVVSWVLLRRDLPIESRAHAPEYRTREWLSTSGHFIAISLAQLILSAQADILVVGSFLGTAPAGLYGVASQFAALVGFGSAAIMVIAQPMIAGLYARGRLTELRALSRQIVKLCVICSLPFLIGLIVLGRLLLSLYGHEFVAAYPILVILSLSQFVAASVGMLVGYLLTMTEHQDTASKLIGASAVLNLALTLTLTPRFGTMGAAIATAIATLARSVALYMAARRLLGSTAVTHAKVLD